MCFDLIADDLLLTTIYLQTNIAPPVTGVGGKTMAQYFEEQEGPTAYCGTTIPGFPNIFLILGPNVASGHASAIFVEEVQVSCICDPHIITLTFPE